ncbi:SUPPRESSOR OF ABI3-5 [Aristolochia californica]|uniref:SUPPRESSOR OF ABI3-5 n=1 Tax=Aristolochia californica TaxID=171875 RepID=UPI0035DEDFD1
MAGTEETASGSKQANDCFQWDEDSQLYFHASSGFYHDPNAGWYYSSKDGLYYTYSNGGYQLLEPEKGREDEGCESSAVTSDEPFQNEEGKTEGMINGDIEKLCPCPPSEWLEDTLIDLYLAGYSNLSIEKDEMAGNLETHVSSTEEIMLDASGSEMILSEETTDCVQGANDQPEPQDISWEEENWLAQYGQVAQTGEDSLSSSAIDLWDWEMVIQNEEKRHREVARLVGRLVKRSSKLHPSLPASATLLKTAAICESHLDLVRVASGQVYRLRTPNSRYLASLSKYDSSNPTGDWGFPDLVSVLSTSSSVLGEGCEYEYSDQLSISTPGELPSVMAKHRNHTYRDRAAERRSLHGGFGVGPGQKHPDGTSCKEEQSSAFSTEEAAAEAVKMSFGAGSYGRRILENMGWKEGEALGNTNKGPIEPLQVFQNKGNAGIGWNRP